MSQETRVLIVEDEPIIAFQISHQLEEEGYKISGIAHSYDKAIDKLGDGNTDIVLLDIMLKGDKTGIDLAHIINQSYSLPFVFLTSYADKNTLEKVKHTYPFGYLVKPFKDADLAPAIEVALVRFQTSTKGKYLLPTIARINEKLVNHMTAQEYSVMEQIWNGNKNADIASLLNLSINTIKTHVSNIYLKLDVHNRSSAIVKIRSLL